MKLNKGENKIKGILSNLQILPRSCYLKVISRKIIQDVQELCHYSERQ